MIDWGSSTPAFDGVVAGKGLEDELAGTMFVAVMSNAGEARYMRVPPEIADGLRQGEAVRIGSEVQPWVLPADRIIAHAAQENGGVYDPARHERALESYQRGRGQPGVWVTGGPQLLLTANRMLSPTDVAPRAEMDLSSSGRPALCLARQSLRSASWQLS